MPCPGRSVFYLSKVDKQRREGDRGMLVMMGNAEEDSGRRNYRINYSGMV
jgi:hypothetical protein